MNYRDTSNHSRTALLRYADPIVSQLWPAIATLGFLSLIPFLGLGAVFSGGIMEFLAALSLPLSLALAIVFCGLTFLIPENGIVHSFLQRCCNYWAGFAISLCSATLGVVAGLFFPYWCATDISSALSFLSIGLIAGVGYGLLAHYTGVVAFSEGNHRLGRFKPWFGFCLATIGSAIASIAIYNQWLKLNDF